MNEGQTKPMANRSSKRSTSVQSDMCRKTLGQVSFGETIIVEMGVREDWNLLPRITYLPTSEEYPLDRDEKGSSKGVDSKNK